MDHYGCRSCFLVIAVFALLLFSTHVFADDDEQQYIEISPERYYWYFESPERVPEGAGIGMTRDKEDSGTDKPIEELVVELSEKCGKYDPESGSYMMGPAAFACMENGGMRFHLRLPVSEDALTRICAEGTREACLAVGKNLYGRKAYSMAIPQFARGCELGDARACTFAGSSAFSLGTEEGYVLSTQFWRDGCDGNYGLSCALLGNNFRSGLGVEKRDLAKAASLLGSGCKLEHGASCYWLAEMHLNGEGVPREFSIYFSLLNKACTFGYAKACEEAQANIERRANMTVVDAMKECDEGGGEACARLGTQFKAGEGVPRSELEASRYFEKACKLGETMACGALGLLLLDSDAQLLGDQNERGLMLLKEACRAGHLSFCTVIGVAYRTGKQVKMDGEQANRYLSMACDGGEGLACDELGQMRLSESLGMPQSGNRRAVLVAAYDYLARGCARDVVKSCLSLGLGYIGAEESMRDDKQGRMFLGRGCELGSGTACFMLGMYLMGYDPTGDGSPSREPTTSDQVAAVEAFEAACRLGEKNGCYTPAKAYYVGELVPRNLNRVLELSRRGCELGDKKLCELLEALNAPASP